MKKLQLLSCLLVGFFGLLSTGVQAQEIEGEAYYMTIYDGKLAIGGYFKKSDRRIVNNITTWDGTKFAGLGKGIDGICKGLAVSGKDLYAIGDFSYVNKGVDDEGKVESNRIAKWDGTKWVSLGKLNIDREIFAVAAKDGKVYAGGNFTKVGGEIATRSMAMNDGKKWFAVGNAQFDRAVTSMCFVGSDLYVGGIFTINGEEPMERFAKWDGKTWTEPVRGGLGGIKSMATDGKNLYLGGSFGVKIFDGTKLSDIPGGPTSGGEVFGIFVDGKDVYFGGNLMMGKGKSQVAKWDGQSWTSYPNFDYTTIRCVAVYNGVLYAGGLFDDNKFKGICKLENGAWVRVLPQ